MFTCCCLCRWVKDGKPYGRRSQSTITALAPGKYVCTVGTTAGLETETITVMIRPLVDWNAVIIKRIRDDMISPDDAACIGCKKELRPNNQQCGIDKDMKHLFLCRSRDVIIDSIRGNTRVTAREEHLSNVVLHKVNVHTVDDTRTFEYEKDKRTGNITCRSCTAALSKDQTDDAVIPDGNVIMQVSDMTVVYHLAMSYSACELTHKLIPCNSLVLPYRGLHTTTTRI